MNVKRYYRVLVVLTYRWLRARLAAHWYKWRVESGVDTSRSCRVKAKLATLTVGAAKSGLEYHKLNRAVYKTGRSMDRFWLELEYPSVEMYTKWWWRYLRE